ncbi:MAG: hypothetical protein JST82_07205 [Bacteroidetes bacterium]|nr:hypothetical protein [Bacteroidota bacterium]
MKYLIQIATNKKIAASLLLSFTWVKNYQYSYNVEAFNTQIINIWAFILWLIGGYIFLCIYDRVRTVVESRYLVTVISWCIYFLGLLLVEYTGYNVLGIHENSARGGALIFGLIHGNMMMHIYYLSFPILSMLLYQTILIVAPVITKWTNNTSNAFRNNATWS